MSDLGLVILKWRLILALKESALSVPRHQELTLMMKIGMGTCDSMEGGGEIVNRSQEEIMD